MKESGDTGKKKKRQGREWNGMVKEKRREEKRRGGVKKITLLI